MIAQKEDRRIRQLIENAAQASASGPCRRPIGWYGKRKLKPRDIPWCRMRRRVACS